MSRKNLINKNRKKLYYSTKDVLIITGLKRYQLKRFEDEGFISPSKIENGRRYYSEETVMKLKKASALLGEYGIKTVMEQFKFLEKEAKLKLYRETLMEIKERIERLIAS